MVLSQATVTDLSLELLGMNLVPRPRILLPVKKIKYIIHLLGMSELSVE